MEEFKKMAIKKAMIDIALNALRDDIKMSEVIEDRATALMLELESLDGWFGGGQYAATYLVTNVNS